MDQLKKTAAPAAKAQTAKPSTTSPKGYSNSVTKKGSPQRPKK